MALLLTATHDVNNPNSGAVMKKLGMVYQYSYEEQWQPKDIPVLFRLYQMDLDGNSGRPYLRYWEQSRSIWWSRAYSRAGILCLQKVHRDDMISP
mgnify:FL=1